MGAAAAAGRRRGRRHRRQPALARTRRRSAPRCSPGRGPPRRPAREVLRGRRPGAPRSPSGVRRAWARRTRVLVAGKGHETGQEIAGVVHPFDDRDGAARARSRGRPASRAGRAGTVRRSRGDPADPGRGRGGRPAAARDAADPDAVGRPAPSSPTPGRSGPGGLFVALPGERVGRPRLRGRRGRRRCRRASSRAAAGRACRRVVVDDVAGRARPRWPARVLRPAAATLHRRRRHRLVRQDQHQGPARPGARGRRADGRAGRARSTTRSALPLTVLRADADPATSCSRWGPAGSGTSRYLCGIAPPRIGVVLNVGAAHVGRVRRPRGDRRGQGRAGRGAAGRTASPSSTPTTRWCARWPARTAARVRAVRRAAPDADVRAEDVALDAAGRPALPPGHARRAGATVTLRAARRAPRRQRARRGRRRRSSAGLALGRRSRPRWPPRRRRSRWRMEVDRRARTASPSSTTPTTPTPTRCAPRSRRWSRSAPAGGRADLGGARRDARARRRRRRAEHDAVGRLRGPARTSPGWSSVGAAAPRRIARRARAHGGLAGASESVRGRRTSSRGRCALLRRRAAPGRRRLVKASPRRSGLRAARRRRCSTGRPTATRRRPRVRAVLIAAAVSLVRRAVRHAAVHPVPGPARLRPVHPRRRPDLAPHQARHAHDGRRGHHRRHAGRLRAWRTCSPCGRPTVSGAARAVPHDRPGPGRASSTTSSRSRKQRSLGLRAGREARRAVRWSPSRSRCSRCSSRTSAFRTPGLDPASRSSATPRIDLAFAGAALGPCCSCIWAYIMIAGDLATA